jgi:hypothetical protein
LTAPNNEIGIEDMRARGRKTGGAPPLPGNRVTHAGGDRELLARERLVAIDFIAHGVAIDRGELLIGGVGADHSAMQGSVRR